MYSAVGWEINLGIPVKYLFCQQHLKLRKKKRQPDTILLNCTC
jgi:hypothetical protein